MYGDAEDRERLRNGIAWAAYQEFQGGSYDALLYDIEFGPGHRLDVAKVDFDRSDIDLEWCYTSQQQLEQVREADRVFSEILQEEYLSGEGADEWVSRNFIEDSEVTFKTLTDTPPVRGYVAVEDDNNVRRELERLSEGLFEYPLTSERYYPRIWVEGESIYD